MEAIGEQFRGTAPPLMAQALGIPFEDGPFDTVLMGWNTYAVGMPEQHLASPYGHLRQIVFTHGRRGPDGSHDVRFTGEDPVRVVRELKQEPGRGIWLCGGGSLAAVLADEIDRLALKINPVSFGGGIRLFGELDYQLQSWTSTSVQAYDSGVVLAQYERR